MSVCTVNLTSVRCVGPNLPSTQHAALSDPLTHSLRLMTSAEIHSFTHHLSDPDMSDQGGQGGTFTTWRDDCIGDVRDRCLFILVKLFNDLSALAVYSQQTELEKLVGFVTES